jgi:Fungal specific transcription factor domain
MAQRIAFEGLLCEPSIAMLQIFTLMAFYLMGACRRNAAFMYLGIACKAACSLGLQGRDSHTPFDKNEPERSKR